MTTSTFELLSCCINFTIKCFLMFNWNLDSYNCTLFVCQVSAAIEKHSWPSSFQLSELCYYASPKSSFLQTEHPKFVQSVLTEHVLKSAFSCTGSKRKIIKNPFLIFLGAKEEHFNVFCSRNWWASRRCQKPVVVQKIFSLCARTQ